eukprot:GDKJ01011740.1.p1 GENE.GDKJ01011740.1~~GDKJ01011740.1.p1  ORF type:complete len:1016 (-),score=372.89 GDKJ01011740.1:217-3264(-)
MVQKKKVGKERLDKYYHLAKEQGYRSRAAFKLIQLAKKHDFFSSAQVCIDLCAAPGGWMQVAQKHMPIASKIVGIDLVPIKAIRGCTAIQADITTARCRTILKKELQGMSADVVLHDGAPNTGTSWMHDAYVQNELVLHSFKLATEFLRPGGHFITKVFRSIDYNSLLWVFQQLFHRVEATKPQASRNVSAEIFVMCMGYKNPSHIDPKFFDPLHVFAREDESAAHAAAQNEELDIEPEEGQKRKKSTGLVEALNSVGKRNRGGYEEGDDFRVVSAVSFINSDDPAKFLISAHKLDFKKDKSPEAVALLNNPLTESNILELSEDIKVLGKRDLANLLTWRYKIRRERAALDKQRRAAAKKDDEEDDEEESAPEEEKEEEKEKGSVAKMAKAARGEEDVADEKLQKMLEETRKLEKRDAKKLKEKLRKREHRMKMSLGGFVAGEAEDPELFRLTPGMMEALQHEDDVLQSALEKAVREGKEVSHDTNLYSLLENSDEEMESGDEFDDSEMGDLDEDQKRILRLEKSMSEQHSLEKEDQRVKRNAAKKARKEDATRREKVTMEWANEINQFDKYIDEEAERVLKARNDELYGSDSDEDSSEDDESDADASENWIDEDEASVVDSGAEEEQSMEDSDEEEEEERNNKNGKNKRAKSLTAASDSTRASSIKNRTPSSTGSGLSITAERWLSNPLLRTATDAAEEAVFSNEIADEDLVQLPLTEKQKAKLRRAKDAARKEKKDEKKAKKEAAASGVSLDNVAGADFKLVDKDENDKKKKKAPSPSSFVDEEKKSQVGKFSVVPRSENVKKVVDSDDEDHQEEPKEIPEHLKKPTNRDDLIAIQSLGAMMIHKRTRMDLIDGAWNRYAWHDDADIPEWFVEDDIQHSQPQLPLTKEVAKELRQKFRDIAARPIRKEQEALARNKMKAEKKFRKAKKAAEAVANETELSEASKAQSIRKIMRKAVIGDKREKNYVVGNKAGGLREGGKQKGGKNTSTVVVDKRLKKDKRGVRNQKKREKKRR